MRFLTTALFGTLCLSVTVVIPPASSVAYGDCTTTSAACPDSSACVAGSCIACKFDPRKCMRSVEKCQALKCAANEGCYIHDEVDDAAGTVTSTLMCAPKDPCSAAGAPSCGDEEQCVNVDAGDRPPVAQCRPYDVYATPCDNKKCPDGNNCAVRRALCGDSTCVMEDFCINEHDCEDCDTSYQFCEISVDNGIAKGQCSNFKNRWDD